MMRGRAPGFWWRPPGWQAMLLSPAAAVYGSVARWRLDHGERADAGVPVVCVGNFVVGGGGKTPTVLALGRAAIALGRKPGFLSRGYGGTLNGPVLVDGRRHAAGAVGDEPMLLADVAPTVIAADRKSGAALLCRDAGVDLVIMDDGFQSARLGTDLAVLVVDAGRGIGNGRVIPAGPLRAPLADQMRRTDALVVVGAGAGGTSVIRTMTQGGKSVHAARLRPRKPERWQGRRVLAFAGIADPGKFYASLREAGADIVLTRDFPDHHSFSAGETSQLAAIARSQHLTLATTRKDAVRLSASGAAPDGMASLLDIFDVDLEFESAGVAERMIGTALDTFRHRRIG